MIFIAIHPIDIYELYLKFIIGEILRVFNRQIIIFLRER